MPEPAERLPSWRPGPTRDAVLAFLEKAAAVPRAQRLACLDNDGTLWCEKPTYVQFDFFVDVLETAVGKDPSLAQRPEFAALLSGDSAAIGEIGLERIAFALASLCAGISPEAFTALVADFMGRQVEGLVLVPSGGPSDHLRPERLVDVPLVLASRRSGSSARSSSTTTPTRVTVPSC